MVEILAIVIGTCGALMIFQKDIFVNQVENQSRFISNTILNNLNRTESRYFMNNGTFLMTNCGDMNHLEYGLNFTHTKLNLSDNHRTLSKILDLEMDGRTKIEKTKTFTLVDCNCFISNMWPAQSV